MALDGTGTSNGASTFIAMGNTEAVTIILKLLCGDGTLSFGDYFCESHAGDTKRNF